MASIRSYPNGAGGTTGAVLATARPALTSGVFWYVGNAVAGASNSNTGTERDYPLLTLQQAVTNSSAADTIVLLARHSETISSVVTLSKAGLSIVGEGSGSTIPRLTNGVGVATDCMLKITAASVMLDNIYFPASPASARERVEVLGGSGTSILQNLSFECGASDAQRTVFYTTIGNHWMSGCTFTAVAAGANAAIEIGGVLPGLTMDDVTFDGGSFSWTATGYALQPNGGGIATGLRATNIRLLNSSHVQFATGTTGTFDVVASTGDSRVDWTP
jgi:hypothetical protein